MSPVALGGPPLERRCETELPVGEDVEFEYLRRWNAQHSSLTY